MHSKMRMRGAESHYRTHDGFTKGLVDAENVIKLCMVAFPSLWMSCNHVFGIASC